MSDYALIAKAINYFILQAHEPPSVDEVAAHLYLSSFQLQRLCVTLQSQRLISPLL